MARMFAIRSGGDPFNTSRWEVSEFSRSFDEDISIYRGDLSGMLARDPLIRRLRTLYPGCQIRVEH